MKTLCGSPWTPLLLLVLLLAPDLSSWLDLVPRVNTGAEVSGEGVFIPSWSLPQADADPVSQHGQRLAAAPGIRFAQAAETILAGGVRYLLNNLAYGDGGDFAGFTGTEFAAKECDWALDSVKENATLYNQIKNSCKGKAAQSEQDFQDFFNGDAWGKFTDYLEYVTNTLKVVFYALSDIGDAVCFSYEPPKKYGYFTIVAGLATKKERMGIGKDIIKSIISSFLEPIKLAGKGIKYAGKAAGYKVVQNFGDALAEIMEPPEVEFKKAVKVLDKFDCNKLDTTIEYTKNVVEVLDAIGEVITFWNIFVLLPNSYRSCATANDYVADIVSEAERTGSTFTCNNIGRKLLLSAGSQQIDIAQVVSTWATINTNLNTVRTNVQAANDFIEPLMNSITETRDKAAAVIDAISSLGDITSELKEFIDQHIPKDFTDFLSGMPKLDFDPCSGNGLTELLCKAGDAWGNLQQELADGLVRLAAGVDPAKPKEILLAVLSLQVPVPKVFVADFPNLDIVDPVNIDYNLGGSLDTIKAKVKAAANVDLLGDLLFPKPSGTQVTTLTETSDTNIFKRKASTSQGVIDLSCPANYKIYVESAILEQPPSCRGDYTSWLRFPCATNECLGLDWTIYNWKCLDPPLNNPLFNTTERTMSIKYLCVSNAAIASGAFKLLPELNSATITGAPVSALTVQTNVHLPTASRLRAFNTAIGQPQPASGQESSPYTAPGLSSTATLGAQSSPPYKAFSQGSLKYNLPTTTTFTTPQVNCTNAGGFGLPILRIEAIDASPCYNRALWTNGVLQQIPASVANSDLLEGDVLTRSTAQTILEDMCGWRLVARLGTLQGANGTLASNILSLTPPMLLPWNSPPDDASFGDFWVPKGVCEYFAASASATVRSHLANGAWPVWVKSSAADCKAALTSSRPCALASGSNNDVFCAAQSTQGAAWPLIDASTDPLLRNLTIPSHVCPSGIAASSDSPDYNPCNGLFCNGNLRTPNRSSGYSPLDWYYSAYSNPMTGITQWNMECKLETVREQEYKIRKALHDAYTAANTALGASCSDAILRCNGTKGSCSLPSLLTCDVKLGAVQYACVEDTTLTNKTVTLVFRDSFQGGAKRLSCGANQKVVITVAELGQRTTSKDVTATVLNSMCDISGQFCDLDTFNAALNAQAGDVLRVVSTCTCGVGFEPTPVGGSCTPCSAGYYRGNTSVACVPSPKGSYIPGNGSATYIPCPAGTFSATDGATSCSYCASDYYSTAIGADSDVCLLCSGANKYVTVEADGRPTGCATCQAGYVRIKQSGLVLQNATGDGTNITADVQTASCVACPPGTYRSAANAEGSCVLCASGTYAQYQGSANCTEAPLGTYVPGFGALAYEHCLPGTYQDETGQTSCKSCPSGQTNNRFKANSSSSCYTPVSISTELLQQIQNLSTQVGKCEEMLTLAGEDPAVAMQQINNSICNRDLLNSAACGWDGGDCCPSTCTVPCEQVLGLGVTTDGYVQLTGACSQFQCLDPSVDPSGPAPPVTCTGELKRVDSLTQVLESFIKTSNPSISLTVAKIEATTESSGGASATGIEGWCDDFLNNAENNYDGGDCCRETCIINTSITNSCQRIDCKDPGAASRDTVGPVISVLPALQLALTAGGPFPAVQATAYDAVDGVREVTGPNITTSVGLTLSPGDLLPSRRSAYTIHISWSSQDAKGNAASITQMFIVNPAPDTTPPVISGVPADKTVTMGSVLTQPTGVVAVDAQDGDISLASPTITVNGTSLPVEFNQPLPTAANTYTVSLTWTAADSSGNTATATQTITVQAVNCATVIPVIVLQAVNRSACDATVQFRWSVTPTALQYVDAQWVAQNLATTTPTFTFISDNKGWNGGGSKGRGSISGSCPAVGKAPAVTGSSYGTITVSGCPGVKQDGRGLRTTLSVTISASFNYDAGVCGTGTARSDAVIAATACYPVGNPGPGNRRLQGV